MHGQVAAELSGTDVALLAATLISAGAWLLAAGAVYLLRKPPEPPVGLRTLDLGPEPPAVANFLVNDFRVGSTAVAATLLDLASRRVVDIEQRGPENFYVRLRPAGQEPLTAYEMRVLAHLRSKARDGVVPADALTTGPRAESRRWRRAFDQEVIADAQDRGLSRDALDSTVFGALTAAAFVPALLGWVLSTYQAAILVLSAAIVILGWIRARHPQRETPEGLAAASRWLGVREELEENEAFSTHSPLTVVLWNRLLAYGAALGVARGAERPLPMGVEPDHRAWTAYGGSWRVVSISFPRVWPIAWGLDPVRALVTAVGGGLGGALFLYFLGPSIFDLLGSGFVVFDVVVLLLILIPCAAIVVGVALGIMAWRDARSTVELAGRVLRLRSFGNDDARRRLYVALDDGRSSRIHAFRVASEQYAGLRQGDDVSMTVTPNLGCVRSIVHTGEPAGQEQ